MEEQITTTHEKPSVEKAEAKILSTTTEHTASTVPIVRASTPRPQPFGPVPAKTELPLAPSESATRFPVAAPDAPPVPEDAPDSAKLPVIQDASTPSQFAPDAASTALTNTFFWLFEYALEMDPALLNRPERLDGSAFAYGPAVLHGYQLGFEGLDTRTGHVLATLIDTPNQPEAEVWGILYRVPHRLTLHEHEQVSALDRAHHAETFAALEVQVRDAYRHRAISCLTYVATPTTRQHVSQLTPTERTPEPTYVKRLVQIARRQKLPGSYVRVLEDLVPIIPPQSPTPPEQTTDPLPAVQPGYDLRNHVTSTPQTAPLDVSIESTSSPWDVPCPRSLSRWLMSFALYVCLLLLATLMLAIVQGLGVWADVFNENFAPLGTPWYVLLYGLLGGCMSCVILLSRPRMIYPPTFVVLTWFIRPFVGALLGALSYLMLNSGIILLTTQPMQHFALCSLVGALAGLCEGRLLFGKQQKKRPSA